MFDRLLKNLNKLDLNEIFREIWSDKRVQNLIIELNTEGQPTSQLLEFGIDSRGQLLRPPYTRNTVQIKVSKGQVADHVTLKDTGDWYKTFKVAVTSKGFVMIADEFKEDTSLFDKYGEDIVGLTEENIEVLLQSIEPDFEMKLAKAMFK